jgi:hypothetical protein
MFVTMVVIAIEVSIISVEATTAIMMQTEKLLGGKPRDSRRSRSNAGEVRGASGRVLRSRSQRDPSQDWPGPAFHHSRELRTTVR